MPDDATLLRRYAATRAEDAFAELVRRHLDGVYSAALRRVGGDAHLAQDVAQLVFVALARKADSVARHPVLSGWLYITTRNEAANVVRHERRRKGREQEAYAMHDTFSKEPAEADWKRVAPILDEVMDELSEADRAVVLLRFVDHRPFAQIGATLRVSEDAARMRVERALDKLRTLLARRSIVSTSTALGAALANHAVMAAPAGLAALVTGTALTSATIAAGPIATAFQFMITSKIASGVAGVVLLAVALGTATHESRAKLAATDSLAVSVTGVARFEERLRDAQQRAALAEQALSDTRATLATMETRTATPQPRPSAAAAADPIEAGNAFLAQHPEARELWDERERANITAKFGPIFRMLNLTAAQQDQLASLALQSMSGTTVINGDAGAITLRREPTLTRQEAEEQLQGLLGAEKYARFHELAPLGPTFDLTLKLASALYRTEPLRPGQTERVMQIFADASPVAQGGRASGPAGIDWRSITTAASEVLSTGQLAALEGVQRNFEYQQAVYRLGRTPMEPSVTNKSTTPPTR